MRPLTPLSAPVDPIRALERISWLLERRRESTYRVEAFRRAGQAAAGLDPSELHARAVAGTLTAIKGIGKTTAAVIAEAADGELPGYLARLQGEDPPLAPDGAEGLVEAVVGDLHAHTDWSDGGAPIDEKVPPGTPATANSPVTRSGCFTASSNAVLTPIDQPIAWWPWGWIP